jgi:hypothetical protein
MVSVPLANKDPVDQIDRIITLLEMYYRNNIPLLLHVVLLTPFGLGSTTELRAVLYW